MSLSPNLLNLQNRFRGALLGVLVGDCYGASFEFKPVEPTTLLEEIRNLMKSDKVVMKFTDDTAMTKSTCRSLLENKGFVASHLARAYSESFFKEPLRGYGQAVKTVFSQLRDSHYKKPFEPASQQFNGNGSFGNGAAMRCCGIALFAHKNKLDDRQTMELVENCSRITHTHLYGINGAILLVQAIRHVLTIEDDSLEENEFLDHMIKTMSSIEDKTNDYTFTEKLRTIKRVVEQLSITGKDVNQKDIVYLLGNDVSAQNSVPLAIYSFIRGNSKFNDSYKLDNEFLRTLHWSISCGGDTDTIGSMACALSGAYLGVKKITESLYNKCEGWEEMISLADKLILL